MDPYSCLLLLAFRFSESFIFAGGTGAEIMAVPIRENSQQGGLLGGFYRSQGIQDGDCYNVKV